MNWMATHCIICTEKPGESRTIEVMAWDRGCDHPGPTRYALYTPEEWQEESEPVWGMDVEGRVWFKGKAVTAVVEGLLT